MKFFYKWLAKKLNKANEANLLVGAVGAYETIASSKVRAMPSPNMLETHGMNFSIHKANGGYIVQYSQYDRRTDRSDNKLHIITDDKDLGEELGKIITLESLRS